MNGQSTLGPDLSELPYEFAERPDPKLCAEPGCSRQVYLDDLCKLHRDVAQYRAEAARRVGELAECQP